MEVYFYPFMSGEMTYERLEKILNMDKNNDNPHILSIEKPSVYRVDIFKTLWDEREKDKQDERIKYLEDYVNLVFIHDNFDTNEERMAWKVELDRKNRGFSEAYNDHNALKFGKTNVVHDYIRDLLDSFVGSKEKNFRMFEKLRNNALREIIMYNQCSVDRQHYKEFSYEDKTAYIKSIHIQVVRVLEFLSEASLEG